MRAIRPTGFLVALLAGLGGSPLLAAPTTGSTVAHAPREVRDVPADIVADCSADATDALNRWLSEVPDGSTLRFADRGCYRVDGTLRLTDRHGLTLNGRGSQFESTFVPPVEPKVIRPMWAILGGSDLVFRGLTVRGTNPTHEFDVRREWLPLFRIAGSRGVVIDNVAGTNAWGDFVWVGPDRREMTEYDGTGAVMAKDVTIRDSTAQTIGRHGVACTGCENLTVTRNDFFDIGYHVFDLEVQAAVWHARDVAFTDNTIGGYLRLSVVANAGIGHDITDVLIAGNVMQTTSVSCIAPVLVVDTEPERSDFAIRDNDFRTITTGIDIAGVSDATINNNRIEFFNGGCSDPRTGITAAHIDGAMKRNDFDGATGLLSRGPGVTGVACGNRVSGSEFNLPRRCRFGPS